MSDIRFNQWLHQSGTGGVSQDHIGNIGIGTTNPSIVVSAANTAVLNVGVITANNLFVNNAFNGDITGNVTGNISGATGTFSGNVDIADKIIHTGDTDTAMRFPADNTFAVDTAGSERLRITSAGNIGIGTDNPAYSLDIVGTNASMRLNSTSTSTLVITSGASNAARIEFGDLANNDTGYIYYDNSNDSMQFATNGSNERLRITSDGRLLINATNNPTLGGQTPYLRVNGGYANLDGLRVRGLDTGNTIWKDGGDMSITVSSAHSLNLKTNSATGLQITSGGQVATPLQPRFFARRSTDQTSYDGRNVGGTWITYDVEDYDIGGNFATSGSDQGRFIAPVSGLYLFHAAAYKQTGTADWSQSWFDIDGSRANGTDFVHSSGTRFAQNAIQVYLTAGQKIGFHPYNNASGNTIIDTATHTWFKGCLLG